MAYLALYRTFRPTTLDEVVRQEHIVTILKNQLKTGRIGHAYLFCGPRGTGKTSIAKIFAAAINCEHPKDGSPCGECETCRALKDPSNLDISEIDAASNNGVDEMRDLREKVQYPPVAGKYKVYIIDEVHMLSTGAFNALLKTLEEPPAHAVFVLATTEAQKIPATILSRCMRFDFKLIPQEDLEKRLRAIFDKIGKKYEAEAISAIARAGAGSVRDMLSIADTCVSYGSGTLTYEQVNAVLGSADFSGICALGRDILTGDSGGAFRKTEEVLAEGKSVGMLLKDLMNFFNSCAVAKTCRDGDVLLALPKSEYEKIKEIADLCDGHRLLRTSEIFAAVESELKYSASPRVLFETALLKASMPQTDYDMEAVLARLAALEKRLASGNFTPAPVTVAPVVEKAAETPKKPVVEERQYAEEVPPPDEEETGGNVYFDVEPTPVVAPKPKAEAPAPKKIAANTGDAKATFGSFLRSLRRTGKNGVLFTICMDLDSAFEDGKFVLCTTSDTMYRSLMKDEHFALIKQALEAIGVTEFDIRLKGAAKDEYTDKLNELKARFSDVKITEE